MPASPSPTAASVGTSVAAPTSQGAATEPARRVAAPPVHARFDYQLGGSYPPDAAVEVVDRDSTSAAVPGRYGICYINVFQTQPAQDTTWRQHHPDLLLRGPGGGLVDDPNWPGEHLLDTSTPAKRAALLGVFAPLLDRCAAAGFQAVEADNLDSFTRSRGSLAAGDNLALAGDLISAAHSRGLAIGQKNAADLTGQGRALGFDFAIAEECEVYDECNRYTGAYGNEVIEIEYTDNGIVAFAEACRARGHQISIILRDRQVVPRGDLGYVDQNCA